MEYAAIIVTNILISNLVLHQFLGICPFLGVSQKVETSAGMGMAVIFVMTVASAVTWLVYDFILVNFGLEYLQTVAFILVIASLVQFVEILLNKVSPTLYQALGIYLPLITTNCAIMGIALINIEENYTFLQTSVSGFSAGIGFTLAIVLFAAIRERLELVDMPENLRGAPAALISAGLMAMAFTGFTGLLG